MNSVILTKTYNPPIFCKKEILRYAGCKNPNNEITTLLESCLNEIQDKLCYKVCYCELPVNITNSFCDFGVFKIQSCDLAKNLKNCKSIILFAATIGVEIDRFITKYGHISPSRALMFQAIGAERIEALCDAFCNDIKAEKNLQLRPRFSPGYGDLDLSCQEEIIKFLDCSKKIGVFLTDGMLMSPSKSVTAFAGLCDTYTHNTKNKCELCDNKSCSFRGEL